MAQPPKPPLRIVRSGAGSSQSNPGGVDWKTLGLTVGFTTLVSVFVTMTAYGLRDRLGRKKRVGNADGADASSIASPFQGGPLMLQGGHFVYVPPSQSRDLNPGFPNALRYTPTMHQAPPAPDPMAGFAHLIQQNNERLDRIESYLHASTTPTN